MTKSLVLVGIRARFALVLGALIGLCGAGPSLAQFSVSASGQATASIPIPVPPGIAGMAPNLYLQYADGGISAHLGVGWSLQGVSMITRCPATRPVDGRLAPVEFKPTDKLCLDGQRLIPTNTAGEPITITSGDASGVEATDGPPSTPFTLYREYRTEKDTYARIRAYGAAAGVLANGPSMFKVWTKAGQVYEYGTNPNNNANSRIKPFNATALPTPVSRPEVAVWAVSRISDVKGNFIDFKYLAIQSAWGSGTSAGVFIGQEWGLLEVQYTGNGAQAPANKVTLEYEPRFASSANGFDQAETYQYGNKNLLNYRLRAVRTWINSPNPTVIGAASNAVPVRTMLFGYEQSPASGRSRLTSVKECTDVNATVCLPPRTFTYQSGTPWASISFATNSSFNSVLGTKRLMHPSGSYGVLTGDFNGDGRTDIIRYSHITADNEVWLSQGGGNFSLSAAHDLTTTTLFSSNGCYTSMVADFNGDGLSDILRIRRNGCSGDASVLLLAQSGGGFSSVALPATMNLDTTKAVYSSSTGDCVPVQNVIKPPSELAQGSSSGGTATESANPTAVGRRSTPKAPPQDRLNSGAPPQPAAAARNPLAPVASSTLGGSTPNSGCIWDRRSRGERFYLLDMDGDGILDVLTTIAVDYEWNSGWGPVPSEADLCLGAGSPSYYGYCSRVYKGSATGAFVEVTDTATNPTPNSVKYSSLYADPPNAQKSNPYWRLPDVADFDGDGLLDVMADLTGRWRSDGNFGFISSPGQAAVYICPTAIDFNGDGRADCLWPNTTGAGQSLNISFGADASGNVTQFNLTGATDHLYAHDTFFRQTVGLVVEDFDGDGRQDILRWGPTAADNGIYFSNGNGSFRSRLPVGLGGLTKPLNAADGTSNMVLGDFLGTGAVQILHMLHDPVPGANTSNQLYSRSYAPLDVLATATSPTGLVTTIGPRVPLTNANGRYINERGIAGDAAVAPLVDLQLPMYVITSLIQQTGAGNLTTEYLYKGLKAERGGRGLLGFREVRQESPTPDAANTKMTVVAEYLLEHPYSGVVAKSTTYLGAGLSPSTNAVARSTTTNHYCEYSVMAQQSTNNHRAPCALPPQSTVSPRIVKPYLFTSVEEGKDVSPTAAGSVQTWTLPKVTTTNTFNSYGDPTQIVVETSMFYAGAQRSYIKTTSNTFCTPNTANCPNVIDDNRWILGRLTQSSVRSQGQDLRGVLSTSVQAP